MDQQLVGRRGLILGAAGLLVSACGGGDPKGDKPNTKGPVIARPEKGNVVTTDDAKALAEKLNAAYDKYDAKALLAAGGPEVEDYGDFLPRWQRRLPTFKKLGFIDGEWYVGTPNGRTRNASGGVVEFSSTLVFAHQVKGCDARQVVESYSCDFRKKSTDAPLELVNIGAVKEFFDPSIWDLGEVDSITTDHTYIVFRTQDAARARQYAKAIEEGAARALKIMPKPDGVNRVFYGLTWPEVEKKLWGGNGNFERGANAYVHRFLEPGQLAKGQSEPVSAKAAIATGRVGLHQRQFTEDPSGVAETSCHEAVHVLADQWKGLAGETPTWVIEGLAEWGAAGGTQALMRARGGVIRANFGRFQGLFDKGTNAFQASNSYENYQCAAAVYAYIDDTMGRDAVFEVARAFYLDGLDESVTNKYGKAGSKLVAGAAKWVRS